MTTTGAALGSVSLPAGPVTVDAVGNSFSRESNYTLVKRSASGAVVFRVVLPSPVEALAGVAGAAEQPWRLVVVMRDRTQLVDPSTGALQAAVDVRGSTFSATPGGGLISSDGKYVRVYDASLTEVKRFGSSAGANDPMPDGSPVALPPAWWCGAAARRALPGRGLR